MNWFVELPGSMSALDAIQSEGEARLYPSVQSIGLLDSELKRRLMDILACPIDKHYPLDLHVFEEKDEIVEGMLVCQECGRWYPIMDEIPQLLPDDLREQKPELAWLEKWRQQTPEKVLRDGKPFTIH